MKALDPHILEQLIAGVAEPVVVAKTGSPDWPVVFCNAAFTSLADGADLDGAPFADVLEKLVDRELALEVSETIRAGREASIPVDLHKQEYLLVLQQLGEGETAHCAGYLRGGAAAAAANAEVQQALLNAKRRIRDLSREDPVTGLLNSRSFREVLDHDWAVAKREQSSLSLVAFALDDFDKYVEVFGRHAADSCQRRVAGALRRCLKRASDVAARIDCGDCERLVVLSHSSEESAVRAFANRIETSVRELGLHHPRSAARFVTVSWQLAVSDVGASRMTAQRFLEGVLDSPPARAGTARSA